MNSQLALAYPHLVPTEAELKGCADELFDAYIDYVHHVSPFIMAISLDTSAYILWAARKTGAKSAVDFGTGFTSYVLRCALDDVTSVDDDAVWAGWTERFLERRGKNKVGQLCDWGIFTAYNDRQYDFVVYDFSGGQMRLDNFDFAFAAIGTGGIGILDDAQQQPVQNAMHEAAAKFRYDLFGLREWTVDNVERYAALVVRP